MSQYHKHCAPSSTCAKKTAKKKPRNIPKAIIEPIKPIEPERILTTKAFCDCSRCVCRDCPDILKLLSITVSDTTCHFGSKVCTQTEIPTACKPTTSPLLDVVDMERGCFCGIVARGIRDHVHMNLGMTERRDKIKDQIYICDKNCENLSKYTEPPAPENPKSLVTKDNTDPAEDTISVEKCTTLCDAECQVLLDFNLNN